MTTPRYYRPKRKADLIRHIEEEHRLDYATSTNPEPTAVKIVGTRWTVDALHELHDGLHKRRSA